MRTQRRAQRPRPGPLDDVGVKPHGAFSTQRRQLLAVRKPLMRVRRSSDSALGIIAAHPVTGELLREQLLSFCGSGSGFVETHYDLGPLGNDLTRTVPDVAAQPRIVNAGVVEVNASGKPAARYDGSDDSMGRADTFGLSGSPALTVGWAEEPHNSNYSWFFGTNGIGTNFYGYTDQGGTQVELGSGGSGRGLDWSPTSGSQYFIADKALAATTSAFNCEANGVALIQESLVAGSNVLNLANTTHHIGSAASGSFHGMHEACWTVFNAVLSGADRAALRKSLAAHA